MSATKSRTGPVGFRCTECGWSSPKWVGRCGECQAWGSVEERTTTAVGGKTRTTPAVPIGEVDAQASAAMSSGLAELDRVLGGGVVPGSVLLLAGEPGVGKSTLLLEVAAAWARSGHKTLYVSAEESAAQVRLRADRTDGLHPSLYLAAETDLAAALAHVEQVEPSLLVIDSVQAIGSSEVDGVPGGVTQVRDVAANLVQVAKRRNIATILVGHVTKEGAVAGPRVLEHLVDVVLTFDGDQSSRLRMIRATKNRHGPVDEVGCFDLAEDGIVEVPDPTGRFVSRHQRPVSGTCVTVTMEGRRPLLAEIQALVAPSPAGMPRRAVVGMEAARVNMILAVLERRAGIRVGGSEVYVSTVGGARLTDPTADLAVAIAVASAVSNTVPPHRLVAMGEVGLAGEVRRVPSLSQRVAEAARLGFTHALVPSDLGPHPERHRPVSGITTLDVPELHDALRVLGLTSPPVQSTGSPE
ncbi:MAG TPA: DNA repair protein RadA [Nocardioidaceae bacterium]|nr:DNA repair protein RadA [Nocardioidaceae bacterium]